MAESKKFIWVELNRDIQPELAKTFFNVSAYPSCIVLGANREKVHRFQSYMKPPEFLKQLDEGLRRYALYKRGKEWDEPTPRPATICDDAVSTTFKAPSERVPAGIAFLRKDMWVATMGGFLYQLDPRGGAPKQEFKMPESILDIASDGRVLYGAVGGWNAGEPIYVIDPATGLIVRKIFTKANEGKKGQGTKGITWLDGKLYLLDGLSGRIYQVNPETGDVERTIDTKQTYVTSLASDGKNLVFGSRTDLILLDPKTGEVVRKIPMNYPLRSVGYNDGRYYVMEQPIFGFDKNHKSIQVWPKEARVYSLKLNSTN